MVAIITQRRGFEQSLFAPKAQPCRLFTWMNTCRRRQKTPAGRCAALTGDASYRDGNCDRFPQMSRVRPGAAEGGRSARWQARCRRAEAGPKSRSRSPKRWLQRVSVHCRHRPRGAASTPLQLQRADIPTRESVRRSSRSYGSFTRQAPAPEPPGSPPRSQRASERPPPAGDRAGTARHPPGSGYRRSSRRSRSPSRRGP